MSEHKIKNLNGIARLKSPDRTTGGGEDV